MSAGTTTQQDQGQALQDRGMLQPGTLPRTTIDGNLAISTDSPSTSSSNIVACGVTSHTIDILPPHGSTHITVTLLPMTAGVQQLSGLILQSSSDGRMYDRLQPFEVLVSA